MRPEYEERSFMAAADFSSPGVFFLKCASKVLQVHCAIRDILKDDGAVSIKMNDLCEFAAAKNVY